MWPDQDETCELQRQAGVGNRDAIDRLLERHRQSLHRMVQAGLNRGLARRVDASDVVQETLLAASRRLAEYLQNPPLPFHAWLRQIARDRLADACRRQLADKRDVRREQSVGDDQQSSFNPAALAPDHGLTPAAMLLKSELASCFSAAVDQLPEEAREIILIRHAEQLTNSQAAEVLGLSEPAASMRYLRALRHLKSLLGGTPSMWLG